MWYCCGRRKLRRSSVDSKKDPWSTPKKLKWWWKKAAAKNNPYSESGLDKFSSLLSDLQDRRARIAAESEHRSTPMLIWFRFSDSNDCMPVVMRLDDETKQFDHRKKSPESPPPEEKKANVVDLPPAIIRKEMEVEKKVKGGWPWRPMYQWLLVLILILLCLVFARMLAIFCTTAWWYMMPKMQGEGRKQRRRMKKGYRKRI